MSTPNTISLWVGIVSIFVASGVAWGNLSTRVDVLADEIDRTRVITEQVDTIVTDIKYIKEDVAEIKEYLKNSSLDKK